MYPKILSMPESVYSEEALKLNQIPVSSFPRTKERVKLSFISVTKPDLKEEIYALSWNLRGAILLS
jgi:hypothetical protein